MAKRHIIPMGKHKVSVQSQLAGVSLRDDQMPYGEKHLCLYEGQIANMQAAYDARIQEQARHERILLLKQKMLDKGLL